ncbi:MAG: hypothetical protein ACLSAP_00620 [Oscillospiraceae bacterium]
MYTLSMFIPPNKFCCNKKWKNRPGAEDSAARQKTGKAFTEGLVPVFFSKCIRVNALVRFRRRIAEETLPARMGKVEKCGWLLRLYVHMYGPAAFRKTLLLIIFLLGK